MAINLATKYAEKIAETFTLGSLVAGNCSKEWDFSGVKSVKIYTPQTVEPVDYQRNGTNRYGTPTEMQDIVQEMTMTQDKSFSLTVDKGNNSEQEMTKNAGKMMKLQQDERMIPMVDKYALKVFAEKAGKVAGISKPTKTTIVTAISDAVQALDDARVPQANRTLYISGEMYALLRTCGEFLSIEKLGEKALGKGIVGEVFGARVCKVPTDYLPKDAFFVLTYKNAVLIPYKIRDAKIHQDPPGISGALLEGRSNFDAFVVGSRAGGVYAAVLDSKACKVPTFTGTDKVTIANEDGGVVFYTTDGSDPRYSDSAIQYSETVTLKEGEVLKAYVKKDGMYPSAVATL